jgi:hypothetical protein
MLWRSWKLESELCRRRAVRTGFISRFYIQFIHVAEELLEDTNSGHVPNKGRDLRGGADSSWRSIVPPSSGFKWKQCVRPKNLDPSTRPHSVITQKTAVWRLTMQVFLLFPRNKVILSALRDIHAVSLCDRIAYVARRISVLTASSWSHANPAKESNI